MANVDMELELDAVTRERLIVLYIENTMSSGSMEVYSRAVGSDIARAGEALLNEAVNICLTAAVEAAKTDSPGAES